MSKLLTTSPSPYYTGQNEYANFSFLDGPHRTQYVYGANLYVQDAFFVTWPSSRLQGGWANGARIERGSFDDLQFYRWSGTARWVQIAGITRDTAGNPLADCTVKVYRTSDDLEIMSTVSQADGAYQLGTFESFQCYLVAYKAGAPDVEGTTPNTIVGS